MNKTFIIAKREFRASIRTKGFLISLLLLPIFMGGGLFVFTILENKVDLSEKRIAVVDLTGLLAESLEKSADLWNKNQTSNAKGEKVSPDYFIEIISPDTVHPDRQKLFQCDRIRNKEIHAFVQIGSDVIHPHQDDSQSGILYYSENSAFDNVRSWFNNTVNNIIREIRVMELGIANEEVNNLFTWVNAVGMDLVNVDAKTGIITEGKRTSEKQTIFVPYVLLLLMFMMIMMSAVPLLTSVMEEKSERIAEVLLGSVTPWQFMMGKITGSLGVSLLTSVIYIVGAIVTLARMEMIDLIPFDVLPWFFIYLFLNIIMVGSIMASLGATCNDSKDAQAIQFPAMLPIIIPLFFMMPIILNPLGKLATGMSLFPLWTPMLMLLRQSTSVTIPAWQPIVGLAGVILFTVLCVWAGARLFRSAIMLQGKRAKLSVMIKYMIKG